MDASKHSDFTWHILHCNIWRQESREEWKFNNSNSNNNINYGNKCKCTLFLHLKADEDEDGDGKEEINKEQNVTHGDKRKKKERENKVLPVTSCLVFINSKLLFYLQICKTYSLLIKSSSTECRMLLSLFYWFSREVFKNVAHFSLQFLRTGNNEPLVVQVEP